MTLINKLMDTLLRYFSKQQMFKVIRYITLVAELFAIMKIVLIPIQIQLNSRSPQSEEQLKVFQYVKIKKLFFSILHKLTGFDIHTIYEQYQWNYAQPVQENVKIFLKSFVHLQKLYVPFLFQS